MRFILPCFLFALAACSSESASPSHDLVGTWFSETTSTSSSGIKQTEQQYLTFGSDGNVSSYMRLRIEQGVSATTTVSCSAGPYLVDGDKVTYDLHATGPYAFTLHRAASVDISDQTLTLAPSDGTALERFVSGTVPSDLPAACPK